MITIVSPKDAYCSKDTAIVWSCPYNQTAYQIEYRVKSGGTWNSLSKVLSSTSSALVGAILDSIGAIDFKNYEYRVRVWSYSGDSFFDEYSEAFNLIVKPEVTGKFAGVSAFAESPKPRLRTQAGSVPLVNEGHVLASRLKTRQGAVVGDDPRFTPTGVRAQGYEQYKVTRTDYYYDIRTSYYYTPTNYYYYYTASRSNLYNYYGGWYYYLIGGASVGSTWYSYRTGFTCGEYNMRADGTPCQYMVPAYATAISGYYWYSWSSWTTGAYYNDAYYYVQYKDLTNGTYSRQDAKTYYEKKNSVSYYYNNKYYEAA